MFACRCVGERSRCWRAFANNASSHVHICDREVLQRTLTIPLEPGMMDRELLPRVILSANKRAFHLLGAPHLIYNAP